MKTTKTTIVHLLLFIIALVIYTQWNKYYTNTLEYNYAIHIKYYPEGYLTTIIKEMIKSGFIEEYQYRWILYFPLGMLIYGLHILFKKQKKHLNVVGISLFIIIMVISNYIFAMNHNGKIENLYIQGVLGIIISLIYFYTYIKTQQIKIIGKFQIIPYMVASCYHILANCIIITQNIEW